MPSLSPPQNSHSSYRCAHSNCDDRSGCRAVCLRNLGVRNQPGLCVYVRPLIARLSGQDRSLGLGFGG